MTALKDIGDMANLPGLSALRSSHLWNKPVDQIHPLQVHAFLKRMDMEGQHQAAETAIDICMRELRRAVDGGEIPKPAMLDYSPPNLNRMTMGELLDGARYMGTAKAAAIIFALETGMDAHGVGRLTWTQAMRMYQTATLTPTAIGCTRACPRQLRLQYVFWEKDPSTGLAVPLFNLDADVFDAFGMIWPELAQQYARLIMIDGASDLSHVQAILGQAGIVLSLPPGGVGPPLGDPGIGPADGAH